MNSDDLIHRYYIGLTSGGAHFTAKFGPCRQDQFMIDHDGPVPLGDTFAYPVSAEIAAEWNNEDEA
jgi:hypothetical protein